MTVALKLYIFDPKSWLSHDTSNSKIIDTKMIHMHGILFTVRAVALECKGKMCLRGSMLFSTFENLFTFFSCLFIIFQAPAPTTSQTQSI